MKVLVTGGAGFVGSNLVDALVEKGLEVVVVDNLSLGREKFANPRAQLVKADLRDAAITGEALEGTDFVFHLAAVSDVREGLANPSAYHENNLRATQSLLEAMRLKGVKKIAFSSTSAVLGEARVIPTPEDYGPAAPISLYGACKLAEEGLISAYCGTFGFQAWVFRFANVVGRHATHGIIPDLLGKLEKNPQKLEVLGNGTQEKSYIDVRDCVSGMLQAVESFGDGFNLVNIGTEDSTTVKKVAEIILEEKNSHAAIEFGQGDRGWPGDVRAMRLDAKKLRSTGWMPKFSSTESVREAVRQAIKEMSQP